LTQHCVASLATPASPRMLLHRSGAEPRRPGVSPSSLWVFWFSVSSGYIAIARQYEAWLPLLFKFEWVAQWFRPLLCPSSGSEFESQPRHEAIHFFEIFPSVLHWHVDSARQPLRVETSSSSFGPAGQRPGILSPRYKTSLTVFCFSENSRKCLNLAQFISFEP
jgi:hypothetical protein